MTHPFLKIEREDTVAVLTMDEPATRNALSRAEQCLEFIDAISSGIALRYTKRLLRLSERCDLTGSLNATAAMQTLAHQTAEHRDSVERYLEEHQARRATC